MARALLVSIAAAVLLAGCVTGLSQGRSPDDPARSAALAERLVGCDLTRFLASRPDFGADRIYVRRNYGIPELLLGPDFLVGGRIYDEELDEAARALSIRGVLSMDDVAAAQERMTRPALTAHRRGGTEWSRLEAAERECQAFEDELGQLRRR